MRSPSAETDHRQMWLDERRADAVARFDARIPALYADPIQLPQPVADWAAAGLDRHSSLFLTGPIGVGKTHTAWAATRTWLAACFNHAYRGNPVISVQRSTTLFDNLRPDAPPGAGRDLVPDLQQADLLVIDDLAAARPSPWTQERLFEIFDERYIHQLPVLITCDVLPSQLSPVVGPRVSSRLREMCSVHLLEGEDRRGGAA